MSSLQNKRCTHPKVVIFEFDWLTPERVMKNDLRARSIYKRCEKCRAQVERCLDCRRYFVFDTLKKNDGERCSRCFDRHQYDYKKGLFSEDSPQDVASSHGFYKKARYMKELDDEKDAEWYEYDGFVVSESASEGEAESDASESESDGGDNDSDYVPDSDESLVIE